MYNIKIDYMRNHFNFFLIIFFYLPTRRTQVSRLNSCQVENLSEIFFGKYLIMRQILQTCEISKHHLKPLRLGSQKVNN